MKSISFTKLFDYAGKEYNILWAECYKLFIKSGFLKYNTITTLYFDDVKDAIDYYNDFHDLGSGHDSFGRALRITYSFMTNEEPYDLKIKHN